METIRPENTVCVLTARGIEALLNEGGSQAWVLDARRARKCEYVICIQNTALQDDWGTASAAHHEAFIVGRLKDVVAATDPGCEGRWKLTFSEYAEIAAPNAWPGNRNPVFYTDLDSFLTNFGINPSSLKFEPMPVIEALTEPMKAAKSLTLAEAKEGLAVTFGVKPTDIEIIIRA